MPRLCAIFLLTMLIGNTCLAQDPQKDPNSDPSKAPATTPVPPRPSSGSNPPVRKPVPAVSHQTFMQTGTFNVRNIPGGMQRMDFAFIPPPRGTSIFTQEWLAEINNRLGKPLRTGYYQYNRNFRETRFHGRHYFFEPFGQCVYSPFYIYTMLPPYISGADTVYIDPGPYGAEVWYGYRWQESNDAGNILAIVQAFQDANASDIASLVPRQGYVEISINGEYRYSLTGNEFYGFLQDAIESVQTVRYGIVSTRYNDQGDIKVVAKHDILDAWGDRKSVYHTFRLSLENGYYVIRQFGTSEAPQL